MRCLPFVTTTPLQVTSPSRSAAAVPVWTTLPEAASGPSGKTLLVQRSAWPALGRNCRHRRGVMSTVHESAAAP
jgi:hypothetical protein